MPLRLILSDSEGGRDYIVALIGPLDLPTSQDLRAWLTNPAPGYGVVLDLSSAAPVSTACVELVADVSRRLAAAGHRLRVIAPDRIAAEAIEAVGVEDVVVDRRTENRLAPGAAAGTAPKPSAAASR